MLETLPSGAFIAGKIRGPWPLSIRQTKGVLGRTFLAKRGANEGAKKVSGGLPPVEPPLTAVWGHGLRPPGCVPVGIWHSSDINIA